MQSKTRVAIVGGGLAGLAAARALSGKASVTVFEKSGAFGGRAETVTKDGFSLNQGAHALYQGGYALKFLKEHGISVTGGPPASERAKALMNGKLHKLPISSSSILTTTFLSTFEKFELLMLFSRMTKLIGEIDYSLSLNDWLSN